MSGGTWNAQSYAGFITCIYEALCVADAMTQADFVMVDGGATNGPQMPVPGDGTAV